MIFSGTDGPAEAQLTTMTTQKCPSCAAPLTVPAAVELYEVFECPECRSELEVLTTDPIRVAIAPEPEEDWGE